MFNVYEVYTWDDVTYTKLSSFEKKEDAEKEAERLNAERRSHNYEPDPICYCVKSDLQYDLLMGRFMTTKQANQQRDFQAKKDTTTKTASETGERHDKP